MPFLKAATLVILTLAVPLHAQQPSPFTPGWFQSSGLMSLRDRPPFSAKVTEKKGTPGSFTLALQHADGTKTSFTLVGGGEAERKMFAHFTLGSEYKFPQVFDDVLGKDAPVSSPRISPISSTSISTSPHFFTQQDFSFSTQKLSLLDLNRCPPFRAKITGKKITPDSISLTIACTDGRTLTLQHSGNANLDEALRIAKPLEEGRFYEFPMSVLPPHQDEPTPPTPAMKALEPFIGEWDVSSLDKPDQKIRVRYHWKINGSGLWREHSAKQEGNDDYRMANAALITHDSTTGRYVETLTRSTSLPPLEKTWDAATRTLSSINYIKYPGSERKHTTITTFKTDDRIDWKTTVTSKEGKFIEEYQGRYTRIKP
ncbi:MAG: DUF1579 family protein [Prosthecobacter sp.]|nr:DUF1579 family protein [Prosthecobacter sp.]